MNCEFCDQGFNRPAQCQTKDRLGWACPYCNQRVALVGEIRLGDRGLIEVSDDNGDGETFRGTRLSDGHFRDDWLIEECPVAAHPRNAEEREAALTELTPQ